MTSWKITLKVPQPLIPQAMEIIYGLDPDNLPTLSDFEITPYDENRLVEAFFTLPPDLGLLRQRLNDILPALALSSPDISLSEIIEKDWVSESQKLRQPVDSGLFFIYGSHNRNQISDRRINLLIEAGQAFGTGEHQTTYGCLQAIGDLKREFAVSGNTPQTALDLGCGSGVLALAMSSIWPITVVASDIDPIATETARHNAQANHIAVVDIKSGNKGIAIVTADGFQDNDLGLGGPYDIIVANILAKPLLNMAAAIVSNLSDGGTLILSGLLDSQESMISAGYAQTGMTVIEHYTQGEWTSLILRRTGP